MMMLVMAGTLPILPAMAEPTPVPKSTRIVPYSGSSEPHSIRPAEDKPVLYTRPTRVVLKKLGDSDGLRFFDTQAYLLGRAASFQLAASQTLRMMDKLDVRHMVMMPDAQLPDARKDSASDELLLIDNPAKGQFHLLGGGGTLNPILHKAIATPPMPKDVPPMFKKLADRLVEKGAIGFGEIALLAFPEEKDRPFMSIPPDSQLMLKLADIAAEKGGLPISFHMEAVYQPMPAPLRYRDIPGVPEELEPNIEALERLLEHNPNTPFVWQYLGVDNTGQRTPEHMRALLDAHPNLYMGITVTSLSVPGSDRDANRLTDSQGNLLPRWQQLFEQFPDRFVIGSGEYFKNYALGYPHPSRDNLARTIELVKQLPTPLRQRIAYDNAAYIYLKEKPSTAEVPVPQEDEEKPQEDEVYFEYWDTDITN